MIEGRDKPFEDSGTEVKNSVDSVKVAVRVRPLTIKEEKEVCGSVVRAHTNNCTITLVENSARKSGNVRPFSFQFDDVFCSGGCVDESGAAPSGQVEVYEAIGRPLVMHAFNGYNSCLFAYGQTGSGKTYTMMGGDPNSVGGADGGVIPRLCVELFDRRVRIEAEGHSKWRVMVGYVEVYNERVSDLLAKRRKGSKEEVFVEVREHPTMGVFIEGQRLQEVSSMGEIVELIESGNRARHTASTKMNDRSSRSHAIFMLTLYEERSMQTASGQVITTAGMSSRMNLVDLAGSERVTQSEVVGQQFNEARYINLSLTTLGRVIDMLADMAKNRNSQWSTPPYRESKLTYILKDSLGGNSKTFMIATISPSALNYDETLSTLRYASRARDIVNVTRVNEDPRARRIRELEEQMERMRQDIKGKDPAYVRELEEKLVLLEAEAQKRAADLHALEKEREKNVIREKMLSATEAEREGLLVKANELERQVEESRRLAEYHEQMSQKLRDEYAQRESELLEKMRQREAEIEEIRQRTDAEVLSREEQLCKTLADLESEKLKRREALLVLNERQEQLNNALSNSQQSLEFRAELERQNAELSFRMQQLKEESGVQQRCIRELEIFRDERDKLKKAVLLLRLTIDEHEDRYNKVVYHLINVINICQESYEILQARVSVEHESHLNANAQLYIAQRLSLERQFEQDLRKSTNRGEELEKQCCQLTEQIKEFKQQNHHLIHGIEEIKRRLSETEKKYNVSEDIKTVTQSALEKEKRSLHLLQERHDAVVADRQELQGQYDGVVADRQELQERYDAVVADRQELQERHDAVVADRQELQERYDAVVADRQELQERHDAVVADRQELQGQYDAVVADRQELQGQYDAVVADRQELQGQYDGVVADRQELQGQYDAVVADRQELQERHDAVVADRQELQERHDAVVADRQELQERHDAVVADRQELQERYDAVVADRQELQERHDAVVADRQELQGQYDAVVADRQELQERHDAVVADRQELQGQYDAVVADRQELQERHDAVVADRQELQERHDAVVADRQELQGQYDAVVADRQELQERHDAVVADRQELQERYDAVVADRQELQGQYDAVVADRQELQERHDAVVADRQELQERHDAVVADRQELQGQYDAVVADRQELQERYDAVVADRQELQERYDAVVADRQELQGQYDAVVADRQELQGRHDAVVADRQELQGQYDAVVADRQELQGRYDAVVADRQELQERYDAVVADRQELQERYDAVVADRQELQERYDAVVADRQELQERYDAVVADRQELQERYDAVVADRQELQERHDAVVADRQELQGQYDAVVADRQELQGRHDAVVADRQKLQGQYDAVVADRQELQERHDAVVADRQELQERHDGVVADRQELQGRHDAASVDNYSLSPGASDLRCCGGCSKKNCWFLRVSELELANSVLSSELIASKRENNILNVRLNYLRKKAVALSVPSEVEYGATLRALCRKP